MTSRKVIMIEAHKIAKGLVGFTGDYNLALSQALKEIWKKDRLGQQIYTGPSYVWDKDGSLGVPEWVIKRNLSDFGYESIMQALIKIEVERKSEKATLLNFKTDFGDFKVWSPKSVLRGYRRNLK